MTPNSLRSQLTTDIINQVTQERVRNPEGTTESIKHLEEKMRAAEQGKNNVKASVSFEQITQCDPNAALATHLNLIDYGFELAERVYRTRATKAA